MNEGIRLFVGLGNPGTNYEHTRHNAGRWFIKQLLHKYNASNIKKGKQGYYAHFQAHPDQKVYCFESEKYMNECGQSISTFARFHKIEPHQILIVYDEMDLPPGSIRLKLGGGSSGHNGLKDCKRHIHSEDFYRLRIGVGRCAFSADAANYVLSSPTPTEREKIDAVIENACYYADCLINGKMDEFMNELHQINHGV